MAGSAVLAAIDFRKEKRMKRWASDPGLRRLVSEKREGGLGRRAFLARLGGATAGAAAASLIGGAAPAPAPKKNVGTRWGTQPQPATRAAGESNPQDRPQT